MVITTALQDTESSMYWMINWPNSLSNLRCPSSFGPLLPAGPGSPFDPGAPDGPFAPTSPGGPLGPGSPWDPGFPASKETIRSNHESPHRFTSWMTSAEMQLQLQLTVSARKSISALFTLRTWRKTGRCLHVEVHVWEKIWTQATWRRWSVKSLEALNPFLSK